MNCSAYIDYNDYDCCNHSNSSFPCSDDDLCAPDENQERLIKTFQTCIFCLIFLLGVTGNCLVIATFALYRRLRLRSSTDVFLFHLALADLLLLLTLPLQAVETHRGWLFFALLCKATRASYAVNTYSGLLLLACISVDRYMVVARAQQMLRLRSQMLTAGKTAAVGVWLTAVLLSLPEILFSGVSHFNGEAYCVMQMSGKVNMTTSGAIVTVFCLSLVVMVTCYALIARVLVGGRRRGGQWRRQRTLKLMLALVTVFLAFQLPYTVVLSLKIRGQFCGLLLEYVTCTLAHARCCLNPLLYALVGVRFRGDVLRLVQDLGCGRRRGSVRHGSASASVSSPALSAFSPTAPERSTSSADPSSIKFRFPESK